MSCFASHMHCNYIFMYYRCVLYMLICCVLLGLDWSKPMIFFGLHVTFSCIHTFISLYSYILICLVLFYVSPFFPLSLSFFSDSCIKALKRKSISSQNPLYYGTSTSSSDPTPYSVQFCDDKARKDFLENFSRRGIHSECQVILSDFSNTNLPTVNYSRGWESLCGIPVTCPSVIIQEFYSYMHEFDYSIP